MENETMPISVSPAEEVAAVRRLCNTQWSLGTNAILTALPRHSGVVVGFLNKALGFGPERTDDDRALRLSVVEALIGRPLISIEKLTTHECAILIDALADPSAPVNPETQKKPLRLSHHGAEIIRWIREQCERSEFAKEFSQTCASPQPGADGAGGYFSNVGGTPEAAPAGQPTGVRPV